MTLKCSYYWKTITEVSRATEELKNQLNDKVRFPAINPSLDAQKRPLHILTCLLRER